MSDEQPVPGHSMQLHQVRHLYDEKRQHIQASDGFTRYMIMMMGLYLVIIKRVGFVIHPTLAEKILCAPDQT